MRPIIRNFLSVIRRFKPAVALNILGLSVAFAAFMVIMIQLNYDFGFDKFHKDYDKIFRVEFVQKTNTQAVISHPLAERFFESSPDIIAGALTYSWKSTASFHVEVDGVLNFYEEKSLTVSPEFFDVFTFNFVEGSNKGYMAPGSIFIPLSLSRKLFGNEPAVGKQIIHNSLEPQTVMAVYRDLPANSIFDNYIYFAMPENDPQANWRNSNRTAYIRVNDPSKVPLLFENFKQIFDFATIRGKTWDESDAFLRFTALPDIHFVTDVGWDDTPKASKQTLLILLAIAIVIVVIAGINFINFSTALTPMRIKNINTQRVLGARRSTLCLSIASEAVVVSILSFCLAILIFMLFGNSPLSKLVDGDFSLAANSLIIGRTAVVALIVGVVAGLYPAFYITSFAPALVLKGSFGLSPKGKKIRNTLIGIQYMD